MNVLSRAALVILCAGCATTRRANSYTPPSATLTPSALEAVTQGMQATDSRAALRFFEDARALAPLAPESHFNLGLAESRLPGRELRAVAWFGAYLASAPQAGNAPAVREEAAALLLKSRRKSALLLELLRFIAGQVASDQQSDDRKRVARLQVKMGEVAAAQQLLTALSPSDRNSVLSDIAAALAGRGDVDGASAAAHQLDNAVAVARAELEIARAQLKAHQLPAARATFASAQKVLDGVQGASAACEARVAFALAELGAGDVLGAAATLAPVAGLIDGIADDSGKRSALIQLAAAQAASGAVAAAIETLRRTGPQDTDRLYVECVEVLAKAGQLDAAHQLAARIEDLEWKAGADANIARAQAAAGDVAGAQQTLGQRSNSWALRVIAEAQLKQGDLAGARATLVASHRAAQAIERAESAVYELTDTAQTQLKAGDGREAARTLDAAEDACRRVPWNEERGLLSAGGEQRQARAALAAADAKQRCCEGAAFDWLSLLSGDLTGPAFLDLDSVITSPPTSGDAQRDFDALEAMAGKVIEMQNALELLLKGTAT